MNSCDAACAIRNILALLIFESVILNECVLPFPTPVSITGAAFAPSFMLDQRARESPANIETEGRVNNAKLRYMQTPNLNKVVRVRGLPSHIREEGYDN